MRIFRRSFRTQKGIMFHYTLELKGVSEDGKKFVFNLSIGEKEELTGKVYVKSTVKYQTVKIFAEEHNIINVNMEMEEIASKFLLTSQLQEHYRNMLSTGFSPIGVSTGVQKNLSEFSVHCKKFKWEVYFNDVVESATLYILVKSE
jgi:hypothetical protein